MFVNRVPRKISGPERNEATGEWKISGPERNQATGEWKISGPERNEATGEWKISGPERNEATGEWKISGPERNEATGEWKRLHIEDLYDQFFSPNIIRVIISRRTTWTGLVACIGVRRDAYRYSMGKPEGTRPLGRQVVGGG